MAFAYATNSMPPHGSVPDLGWVLVGVAALADLGIIGSGRMRRRSKSED